MSNQVNNKSVNPICLPKSNHPRLVIVGGGFAGLALAQGLRKQKLQVVLIDRNNFYQFQPLLYQVATSGLEPDSIVFPFRKQLSRNKNIVFRMAEVENIDSKTNEIQTDKGTLSFDYLVIATGTKTNFFGMSSVEENSIGLKDIRDSLNIRHKMLQNLEEATITCDDNERDALTNFVIVGGGPAGVEMAGALGEFRKYILPKDYPEYPSSIMKIFLIEGSDQLLSVMSDKSSEKTLKYLKELDVNVILNEVVTGYDGEIVETKSGQKISAKNLIWTAGVKGQFPNGINNETNVVRGNRLKVDEHLRIDGHQHIFAMGDIASVVADDTPNGHPQVAQPAIQQGRYLAKNLLKIVEGKEIKPFKYKDKGSLATVGKRKAVANVGRFDFAGYFAWLLWSLVHIMSISGFRNKILVGLNWTMSYFSYEKSNRLIIRDYKNKNKR
jgi:NADH dehydrogenase